MVSVWNTSSLLAERGPWLLPVRVTWLQGTIQADGEGLVARSLDFDGDWESGRLWNPGRAGCVWARCWGPRPESSMGHLLRWGPTRCSRLGVTGWVLGGSRGRAPWAEEVTTAGQAGVFLTSAQKPGCVVSAGQALTSCTQAWGWGAPLQG